MVKLSPLDLEAHGSPRALHAGRDQGSSPRLQATSSPRVLLSRSPTKSPRQKPPRDVRDAQVSWRPITAPQDGGLFGWPKPEDTLPILAPLPPAPRTHPEPPQLLSHRRSWPKPADAVVEPTVARARMPRSPQPQLRFVEMESGDSDSPRNTTAADGSLVAGDLLVEKLTPWPEVDAQTERFLERLNSSPPRPGTTVPAARGFGLQQRLRGLFDELQADRGRLASRLDKVGVRMRHLEFQTRALRSGDIHPQTVVDQLSGQMTIEAEARQQSEAELRLVEGERARLSGTVATMEQDTREMVASEISRGALQFAETEQLAAKLAAVEAERNELRRTIDEMEAERNAEQFGVTLDPEEVRAPRAVPCPPAPPLPPAPHRPYQS